MTGLEISPHDANHVIVTGDMLGVGVSFDGADSWQLTYGLDSYECAKPTFHPTDSNVVWLATLSGPYVSYDRGVHWVSKRKGMGDFLSYDYSVPIERILISPDNPDHLWAFGGNQRHWGGAREGNNAWGSVWKSEDGGESWRWLSTVDEAYQERYGVMAASFGGTSTDTLYVALNNHGVYASFDGGQRWRHVFEEQENQNVYYVEAHPDQSHILYAATSNYYDEAAQTWVPGAILVSENAGSDWEKRTEGLPQNVGSDGNTTAKYEVVRISRSNPNVLFTSNTSWSKAALLISVDGGKQWQETATEPLDKAYPAGKSMEVACFNPNDENNILAAGPSYVLRTTDGGDRWDDATSFHPEDNSQWRGRGFSGLVSRDFAFHPTRSDVSAFTAMDAGNGWISTNNRYTWYKGGGELPTWGGGNSLCFTGRTTLFTSLGQDGFGGLARSSDVGKSWVLLHGAERGLPALDTEGRALKVYARPQDSTQVWAVINHQLYYSSNYGDTWTVVFDEAEVNHFDTVGDELLLATDQGIYRGKENAFQLVSDPGFNVTFCRSDPSNEVIYVCGWREEGAGLWRWQNGDWEQLIDDIHVRSFDINPQNPKEIVVSTDDDPYHDQTFASGIYRSEDRGQTWDRENTGLAMLRGGIVVFNPHKPDELIFGSGGRGFFKGTKVDKDSTTAIEVRARLLSGQPDTLTLWIDKQPVKAWLVSDQQDQSYTVSIPPHNGDIKLSFADSEPDNDVQVDYLAVNGTRYQTEDQPVNTAAYQNDTCGGSYSDKLLCSGYVAYQVGSPVLSTSEQYQSKEISVTLRVYPNPSEGPFTVSVQEGARVQVRDLRGQAVYQTNVAPGQHTIDLSPLPSGIYLLTVGNQQQRLIKQ